MHGNTVEVSCPGQCQNPLGENGYKFFCDLTLWLDNNFFAFFQDLLLFRHFHDFEATLE